MRSNQFFCGFMVTLFIAVFAMIVGCAAPQNVPTTSQFQNIQRVMMHERGHYTVFVMNEAKELAEVEINYPTIKVDAEAGLPIQLETVNDGWGNKYVIHIHKPDEINGAGWSHTNDETTTKGQTTVIE